MIKFGYTIVYVEDVDSALSFYEQAFGFERAFLTPENDYGELKTGETTLAFASLELGMSHFKEGFVSAGKSSQPLGMEIALVTTDIARAHDMALKKGAQELQAPAQKPWGQTVSYVRCPSGVLVELCTPVSG